MDTAVSSKVEFKIDHPIPLAEDFLRKIAANFPELDAKFLIGLVDKKLDLVTESMQEPFGDQIVYAGIFTGCAWKKKREVMCKVNKRIESHLPLRLYRAVSSVQRFGGGFDWIYEAEDVRSIDELIVFLFGHELWHRLCFQKIKHYNHETKANVYGFRLLRMFKNSPSDFTYFR